MKKPRRAIVSEPLYGTSIEVYANYPQKVALRRCAKVMDMDSDDPANAPDDTAAGWCMSHGGWALIWIESYPEDQSSLPHELWHAIHGFTRHIESGDEETGAYLIGHYDPRIRAKLNKKP
jgi:hypothetical protein